MSHLDTVRCWERVFRRASIPLEYTQGFSPHPRISVAVPLAVGVTSNAELMDVWLRKWVPPPSAMMLARREMPAGFEVLDAWEVPLGAPALQASVQMASYRCVAAHVGGFAAVERAVEAFIQAERVVYRFTRGEEERETDLRPLVHSIMVEPSHDVSWLVALDVSVGQQGTARPDHVLSALGFALPAESIQRVALSFDYPNYGSDASGACHN